MDPHADAFCISDPWAAGEGAFGAAFGRELGPTVIRTTQADRTHSPQTSKARHRYL